MQRPATSAYQRRQAKTQRKIKRKRVTGAAVLAGLVVVIFVVALLVSDKGEKVPAVSSQPVSVAPKPPVSSAPVSVPSLLPPATGKLDVEGIPPLFNADHFIPDDYEMELVDVGAGQTMDAPAAAAFTAMKEAAAATGVTLTPVSGYRTNERQTNNYNSSIQNYMGQGYSEEEAIRLTRRYYAMPGTSEHEAGLAMDIGFIEDSFDQTPAFAWLQEHANDYGFIFRYRKEKEEITGIAYEPWHYRYVGVNHAKKMAEIGGDITLEEYVEMLEKEQMG